MACNHSEIKLGSMIIAGQLESDLICRHCGERRKITERDPSFDKYRYATLAERQELSAKFGAH